MRSTFYKYGSLKIKMPHVPPRHFAARKIGLFGGSFNPPHSGHIYAADVAMRRLRLDQVWFFVSPGNPLKSHGQLASTIVRLGAIQKKIWNLRMKVLSIEEELGSSFTSFLISYLRGRYPMTKFIWIMGCDNIVNFHLWSDWKFIIEQVPILLVDRPGWRYRALSSPVAQRLFKFKLKEENCLGLTKRKPPAWVFLKNKQFSTSSTELRGRNRTNL